MHYLLVAYDSPDPDAINRRMKCRPEHFEKITIIKKEGKFICGGVILDETDRMIGSMIIYEVDDRKELDMLLQDEPYICNKVWGKIDINPFKMAKIENKKIF
jgi:uncharacterized protein YciI